MIVVIMTGPKVVYFDVQPGSSLVKSLESLLDNIELDAIIFGVWDSGNILNTFIPIIEKATKKKIAVFGVPQTLFYDFKPDLTRGRDFFDYSYVMQPEAIRAGLIPLQVYPPELLELAEKNKKLLKGYQEFSDKKASVKIYGSKLYEYVINGVSVKVYGSKLYEHVINGIRDICANHASYEKRVKEARRKFSSPEFNARIDEITKTGRMYTTARRLKNLLRSLFRFNLSSNPVNEPTNYSHSEVRYT